MKKEELKRLPFVVAAYQRIYPSESHCGICNLPWSACGTECVDITDTSGVFYVCPHCWKNNDIQEVLKATTKGYLGQLESCTTEQHRSYFLKTHDLLEILLKTEQKYLSTHNTKGDNNVQP